MQEHQLPICLICLILLWIFFFLVSWLVDELLAKYHKPKNDYAKRLQTTTNKGGTSAII